MQASQEDGGVPQRGIHTVTAASQGLEVTLLLYFGILMIVFNIANVLLHWWIKVLMIYKGGPTKEQLKLTVIFFP